MSTGFVSSKNFVGGVVRSSFIPEVIVSSPFSVDFSIDVDESQASGDKLGSLLLSGNPSLSGPAWESGAVGNQTDEDKLVHLTCVDEAKPTTTNINTTAEYNAGYSGISILPWEDFVYNPRVLNDLFFTESNRKITYDPDEVNVFFHGKNVMPPTLGDISDNGKSWNIQVETIAELRNVRQFLTEKCSVFGVTLNYKAKRLAKPERAPCLVMIDPSKETLADRLYITLTRAMDSMHNNRRFSVEINLNGCVERWCSRVLLTECKAVGAKIVITNGEEYESMDGAEDIFCCVVCFPVWLIQTGIYKLHRKVVYDDYAISFDADDMFLHGTAQDVTCQRQYIFKGPETQNDVSVFRTRCTDQTDKQRLQELGTFKFMAVKRFDKYDAEATITEHETTTFGELVNKRKDKIIANDAKLKAKHLLGNHHNDKDLGRTKSEENAYASDATKDISRAKTIIFTNEGFDNDSESDVESDTAPAIPELPSDENNASTNTQIHTEQVSKPNFALDTMFTAKSVKSRTDGTSEGSKRTIENKSLKAVCSFELQDSVVMVDSETYRYDSLHDNKIGLTTTSTFENVGTKKSVLDEIEKLDSSLPNIEHAKPRSTENDGVSSEETYDDKNKKEKSQKKKHKKKVMKDIKELTKTTYAAAPGKPSEMDIRYQKARERLSKNKTKTSSNVKAEINQTHEILRGSIEEVRAKNDEQQRDASGQEDTISVCDDTVSDFKVVESSSDGEEVEMIYQSERQTDRGNVKPVQESAIDTLIDEVKKVNTESLISRKYDNSFDQQNDFNSEDEFKMSDSENEVKPVEFNLYASKASHIVDVRASGVEHDIDVTDLDEGVVTQSNPFNDVPKLRLNTRDSLGKKVKRGSKNTSIRKYLGLNPPLRNKRH